MSLYPTLPTAPPDFNFRLENIRGVEEFLNAEIKERDHLQKKFKRCESTAKIVDTTLTAVTVVSAGSGVAAISTGIGIPVSIALGSLGLATSIVSSIVRKLIKVYAVKAKKHSDITVVAQTILDGITCLISKAINNGDISPEEFETIMKEKERYLTKKMEIRSKVKRIIHDITDSQRQDILEQGRQEGRQEIAKKLISPLDGT